MMRCVKILIRVLVIIFVISLSLDPVLTQYDDLFNAVEAGDIVALQQAKNRGINLSTVKNRLGENLLFYAGDAETAQFLIEEGLDVSLVSGIRKDTPLLSVIQKTAIKKEKKVEVVKVLINANANITAQNEWKTTPLQAAVTEDLNEVVDMLLEKGANPNVKDELSGYTPLIDAVRHKKTEIAEKLLAKGADPNLQGKGGYTPLFFAVGHKEEEGIRMVELLMKHGANINVSNDAGDTLLFYGDSAKMTQFLIKKGLDVNAINEDGETSLISLISKRASYGHLYTESAKNKVTQVVETLVNANVNVNVQDNNGKTALYWAVAGDLKDEVDILLKRGANPNLKTKYDGWTPLHIAAMDGNNDVVVCLLVMGKAEKDLKDNHGRRPVAYSANKAIVSLLGKDDFVIESERVFVDKRVKITQTHDYSKLWAKDISVLFVGEQHGVPEFKAEVSKLIERFKKSGVKLTHYTSEFITKRGQSVVDVYQHTPIPRRKFISYLGDYASNVDETAKKSKVKITGLDIGDMPRGWGASAKGIRERNNQWVNILMGILEKNPNAKILVHCGAEHSRYNAAVTPVSTLLQGRKIKGENIKVKVINLIGPTAYSYDTNGFTAKRLNILNEYFVAPVPEDKAQLIGVDFIMNVPEEPSYIPKELLRPITLPWEADYNK